MTFKEKVAHLLSNGLEENPSLFLVDLTIGGGNKIVVTLDGDTGVTLQDCINISRAIEHNIDREEEEDFSLEVASAGATTPLQLPRQYKKNVGRILNVKTATEEIEADLTDATDELIVLEWEAREAKQIGKGKETVQKRREIPYADIKEAVVVIKF
jgi:ribosome maturation factor RimP